VRILTIKNRDYRKVTCGGEGFLAERRRRTGGHDLIRGKERGVPTGEKEDPYHPEERLKKKRTDSLRSLGGKRKGSAVGRKGTLSVYLERKNVSAERGEKEGLI